MHKAKREDFRVEEELRVQKAKYEETSEEVFRRMQDVSADEKSPWSYAKCYYRSRKLRLIAYLI